MVQPLDDIYGSFNDQGTPLLYFCNDASRKIYYTTNTWYRDLHRNCLYRFLFQTNCSEAFPWVAEKVVAPYQSSFHAFQDTKALVLLVQVIEQRSHCSITYINNHAIFLNSLNLTGLRIYAHDKIIRLRDFLQGISSEEINPV